MRVNGDMCVCSFHDAHLGKDSHDNIAGAHATARAICTDLCHHYHQWCLAIELKAPELAGTVQYSAVQNRTTTCDLCFASIHTHTHTHTHTHRERERDYLATLENA